MGCCNTPGLLPVSDAISKILAQTPVIRETEWVSLKDALNRITAEDIVSPINVPPFANAAMDGYAVNIDDLTETSKLTLIGKSFAGAPFDGEYNKGSCVRIMTGAVIPEGTNAVVMQEDTKQDGDSIHFFTTPAPQQNIRSLGDDLHKGDCVLNAGVRLTARHVPLLATLGVDLIKVFRKPKVAFFSTGDELRPVGTTLNEGEIYDSNRYTIQSMLDKLDCETHDLGVIPDDPAQLNATFKHAASIADVIITSGGVSVGEADFTKNILEQTGTVDFWKLAIKPGKPFAFGKVGNALFCGLPGNPVSVLVTLDVLVRPLLSRLSGQVDNHAPLTLKAIATTPFKKHKGRTDYQRAIFQVTETGELTVSTTGNQGSGAFSSLAKANCFAMLEQERGNVEVGEIVTIKPFDAILN